MKTEIMSFSALCMLVIVLSNTVFVYSGLADEEEVDTQFPYPTWTVNCDGDILDGKVVDMPDDGSYRSNMLWVGMIAMGSTNYDFEYDEFIAGVDSVVNWRAHIKDKTKDAKLNAGFSDAAGNSLFIVVYYTAKPIELQPSEINFGNIEGGLKKEVSFYLKNNTKENDIVIDKLSLKSGKKGFEIINLSLPITVLAGSTYSLKARFTATNDGSFKDTIVVEDNCGKTSELLLSAYSDVPVIYVSDIEYFDVLLNRSLIKEASIVNTGEKDQAYF